MYNKKDKYYCSRTNMPLESDYSFAKAKDCRMSKFKNSKILFYLGYYFQYFYLIIFYITFFKLFRNRDRDTNDQIQPINNRLGNIFNRIHDNLANLGRFFNLRRNRVANNVNYSNYSTERGENSGGDIDFRPEKTINIIIENKKQFIINQNIQNISNNKTNKMINHINSENIEDIVVNSTERIIKFSNINKNNNNNEND